MTNMTQERRPATSVDINFKEFVQTPSGKAVVTRPTWDPSKGAAEAIARAEQAAREQHLQELQRLNHDPAELRIRGLEQAVQALNERLLKLEGQR
jgi:hypothetical protein